MNLSRSDICLPYSITPIAIPAIVLEQENYQVQLWQIVAALAASVLVGSIFFSSIDFYRNQAALLARDIRHNQDDPAMQNLAQQMPVTWPVLGLATLALSWLTTSLLSHYCTGQHVVIHFHLHKASS
jgi:branched-subunit amino acid transport protein